MLLKGIGAINIRTALKSSIKNMFRKENESNQKKSGSQNVVGEEGLENLGTGKFAFNTIVEAEEKRL